MLRKLRITLAFVFFTGITLLLAGVGSGRLSWIAKLQFLPACMALNFIVVAAIVIVTLLFGRFYCSTLCPLGVFQDIVLRLRMHSGRGYRKRFAYSGGRPWIRYTVLALFIAAMVAGLQVVVAMIAPYSTYGRMVGAFIGLGNAGSRLPLVAAGLLAFVVVGLCAWFWGRAWCNTICPVGSVLGLVSRFSLFGIRINASRCSSCGKCEGECKAFCINSKEHKVDYSRCVTCFNCLGACKLGAVSYGLRVFRGKTVRDDGRRNFLGTAAVAAVSVAGAGNLLAQTRVDGGLAEVVPKTNPEREVIPVPFGAVSVKNFYSRCTACQLCVAACPNGVLRPGASLEHFLQPQMGFENGYCRPECNVCSTVCPSGAIRPVSPDDKFEIHIGTARVNLSGCVVLRDNVDCGNCARHCPVGAIRMVVPENGGRALPVVDSERCIGCGACENLCPSRPVSAITVNGLEVHRRGPFV